MSLEEDKLKECKIVFDMFDKDKDGKITTENLGDVMRILGAAPSQDEVEEMVRNIENSKDPLIGFEQFLKLFKRKLDTQDGEKELIQEFKKMDRDGDGKILETDLRALMSNYDNALSSEEIEQVIEEADVDDEGKIDYNRFVQVLLGKI